MSLPQQKYALETRNPFTRADARAAGITVKQLISSRYQKVEYDGRRHADSPEQWERDIYRREDLDRMDYRLLIVTSHGIYNEPHRTLERVRDALRERGVRVPSRFKNKWRRHFPTTA